MELFWSIFSRIWAEYEEIRSISPYSVQMRENADQNNSEYGHAVFVDLSSCGKTYLLVLSSKVRRNFVAFKHEKSVTLDI